MTDFQRPVHDPTAAADTDTDTTATPVPTTPIGAPPIDGSTFGATATAAPAPRRSRARWFAAAGLVALVVAASAAATLMLTGSPPAAAVLGYVPNDSVMYGEVRLDFPGDQRQEVGEFLAKFPGFADQAALDTKLDEVLDRFFSETSAGKQTFTRDVKPWFDGELGFAMGPLPNAAATGAPEQIAASTRMLVLVSIKDEALARTWFTNIFTETGVAGTTEDYAGTSLTVFADPNLPGFQAAFALVGGKVAIAGDVTSVKAAIDTKGASGLAKDEAFVAAQAAASGDHIGFFFMDTRALMDAVVSMSAGMASTPPMSDALLALIPDWTAMRLRVEGDALVIDSMAPHVATAPGPDANRANAVAGYAPPSTIVLAAGNEAGPSLTEALALYRQDPTLAEFFTTLDQSFGLFGGLDASVGWMGDTGVVIARSGDGVEGGLISIPADAAGGKQLLTTIRSFVQLGGGQMGFDVRDEDYNGTTITTFDLGTFDDLAGLAGGMGVPIAPVSGLPAGNVEIAYAANDGVVVIGSSPDFVKHVLDAGAGESLADGARYKDLVGRVGAEHTGVTFLDIAAIRGLAEGLLADVSSEERAEYEESIKPFLSPFDAIVATGVTGADLEQQHILITVK
jgi:hypothetical protein